ALDTWQTASRRESAAHPGAGLAGQWEAGEDRPGFVRRLALYYRNYVSTSEAVFFADTEGVIVDVNRVFTDLYGYEREEVIGRSPSLLEREAGSELYAEVWRHVSHPKLGPWCGEMSHVTKDGQQLFVYAQVDALRDATGARVGFLCHASDITERRRAEEALLAKDRELTDRNKRLSALNHLRSDLIAITSHDMKAPLSAIIGYADLAHSVLTGDGPRDEAVARASELTAKAVAAGEELVHFIHQILDAEKVESGSLTIQPRPMNLDLLVERCVERFVIGKSPRAIEVAHEGVHRPILADQVRLEQVLNNLISNAIRHAPEGTAVEVDYRDDGTDSLTIVVSDRGPGFPAEQAESLFDRYRQLGDDKASGSVGLGLYISRHIVACHGGTITAAPREGGGAVFEVTLPARYGPAEQISALILDADPTANPFCVQLRAGQVPCLRAASEEQGARLLTYARPEVVFVRIDHTAIDFAADPAWSRPALRVAITAENKPLPPGFDHVLTEPVLPIEIQELLQEARLRARQRDLDGVSPPDPPRRTLRPPVA
ncbi:MAG: PAS domain S-box protein, partial [Myxococcales bacterium]|nr:PAS domain S-box protein [Myxococcales bacterium]